MNELALLVLVAGTCVILIVVGVTPWSRRNPAASPRHWIHDAGGTLLSVDWHGCAYLVAAPFVPRGFADHLKRPATQPAQPPKRLPESVR